MVTVGGEPNGNASVDQGEVGELETSCFDEIAVEAQALRPAVERRGVPDTPFNSTGPI